MGRKMALTGENRGATVRTHPSNNEAGRLVREHEADP
jgi:hypothetical protein